MVSFKLDFFRNRNRFLFFKFHGPSESLPTLFAYMEQTIDRYRNQGQYRTVNVLFPALTSV